MVNFWKHFKKSLIIQLLLTYCLIVSGLITNFFQLITLIIWPFDKLLYRKLNYYLSYVFLSNYTAMARWWSCTKCELFIKKEDLKYFNKENSVAIMNHKYDTDWLMGLILCQNLNIMSGIKMILKSSLKYLPVIGWYWILTESIFLKRNWEQDNKIIVKYLKSIFNFPKGFYFTIIMFCEGTRFTEEKHKASVQFAKTKGLPELKHHLLPRTKGFHLLMETGKNKIDAIYDCTLVIKTENGIKPSISLIKDGIPVTAQILVNRIPLSDVPIDDENKCSEFLYKMYERKDEIFDKFVKSGDLGSTGYEKVEIKKNKYDLYLSLMWILLILPITLVYLIKALWFGSLYFRLAIFITIYSINILSKFLMRSTTTDKSSSSFGLLPTSEKLKKHNE